MEAMKRAKASPISLGSGLNRLATPGTFEMAVPGVLACSIAPMNSEWSVTAAKSSGPPARRMSKPEACPMVSPFAKR